MSSTQMQNSSFLLVERTTTAVQKWHVHVQSVQRYFFSLLICKFVMFLFPSSSRLLKLSIAILIYLSGLNSSYITICKVPFNPRRVNGREKHTWGYQHLIRELKQTRRRRKRESHLKMKLRVSAIIFQLFKVIMLEKFVLTILELNWN